MGGTEGKGREGGRGDEDGGWEEEEKERERKTLN